jgi:hypothetical protein
MGSFLGMEFIHFILSGWPKAADTGVTLYILCGHKSPFLQQVANLRLFTNNAHNFPVQGCKIIKKGVTVRPQVRYPPENAAHLPAF